MFIEIRATFLSGATAADAKGVVFYPARSGRALFRPHYRGDSATRSGSFPRERVKVEFGEDGEVVRPPGSAGQAAIDYLGAEDGTPSGPLDENVVEPGIPEPLPGRLRVRRDQVWPGLPSPATCQASWKTTPLADRWNARWVLLGSDATRTVLFAVMPLTVHAAGGAALLLVVAFLAAVAGVFFETSMSKVVQSLLDPGKLVAGNARLEMSNQLGILLGPSGSTRRASPSLSPACCRCDGSTPGPRRPGRPWPCGEICGRASATCAPSRSSPGW